MWIPVLVLISIALMVSTVVMARRAAFLDAQMRQLTRTSPTLEKMPVDQRDAEGRLAAITREYDALLAYCGGGVLLLSADDVIERANLTARYLFGVPTANMIGKSVLEATLSEELYTLVKDARETRCIQRKEICAPSPAGCLLIVVASPVIEEDPSRCRIILVVHDVTELRRLETVRRDFVANVSHELRTPLTSIRAMAETLQDGAMQDVSVACHFLKTIIDETSSSTAEAT